LSGHPSPWKAQEVAGNLIQRERAPGKVAKTNTACPALFATAQRAVATPECIAASMSNSLSRTRNCWAASAQMHRSHAFQFIDECADVCRLGTTPLVVQHCFLGLEANEVGSAVAPGGSGQPMSYPPHVRHAQLFAAANVLQLLDHMCLQHPHLNRLLTRHLHRMGPEHGPRALAVETTNKPAKNSLSHLQVARSWDHRSRIWKGTDPQCVGGSFTQ
jgi:hypothetical protein